MGGGLPPPIFSGGHEARGYNNFGKNRCSGGIYPARNKREGVKPSPTEKKRNIGEEFSPPEENYSGVVPEG